MGPGVSVGVHRVELAEDGPTRVGSYFTNVGMRVFQVSGGPGTLPRIWIFGLYLVILSCRFTNRVPTTVVYRSQVLGQPVYGLHPRIREVD